MQIHALPKTGETSHDRLNASLSLKINLNR
jgi:hypothetical protein